ncbi:hypothetical protein CYMTET_56362, partial [Cymbomonas tetramitiformis]
GSLLAALKDRKSLNWTFGVGLQLEPASPAVTRLVGASGSNPFSPASDASGADPFSATASEASTAGTPASQASTPASISGGWGANFLPSPAESASSGTFSGKASPNVSGELDPGGSSQPLQHNQAARSNGTWKTARRAGVMVPILTRERTQRLGSRVLGTKVGEVQEDYKGWFTASHRLAQFESQGKPEMEPEPEPEMEPEPEPEPEMEL